MFCVLLIIYLICQLFTIIVTILMLKKAKTKAKRQLVSLFLPANLTLFGKCTPSICI